MTPLFATKSLIAFSSVSNLTEKAVGFVELLSTITTVPIELIDERMSTISAARNLRDAGRNAKDSKEAIDMAAAVAILEFALEIEKRK